MAKHSSFVPPAKPSNITQKAEFKSSLPGDLQNLREVDRRELTEDEQNILDRKIDKLAAGEKAQIGDAALHEKDLPPEMERIALSRKLLKEPIPAGLKLFEAPDGYVMMGEAKETQAWYRMGNGGKGMWINEHR